MNIVFWTIIKRFTNQFSNDFQKIFLSDLLGRDSDLKTRLGHAQLAAS